MITMITRKAFILSFTLVWQFSFSTTSYIVPFLLYNVKKVSHPNIHTEKKNQNTKRTMETKHIHFFIFESKTPRTLILWRWLVLWLKMAATLASHVLVVIHPCYFCCSLVNFQNFIILFWNIWVIYDCMLSCHVGGSE